MKQAIKNALPAPLLQIARKLLALSRLSRTFIPQVFRKLVLGQNRLIVPINADPEEIRSLIQSLTPIDPGVPLVRLGPANDVGYLIPDDTVGIEAVSLPGVGAESGFERDCSSRKFATPVVPSIVFINCSLPSARYSFNHLR